jgi:hypothetical protein
MMATSIGADPGVPAGIQPQQLADFFPDLLDLEAHPRKDADQGAQ